jgi:hypothetical protein
MAVESTVFQTTGAARYLNLRGIKTSTSQLEKLRLRGADDPRDRGPDFYRDLRGICIYPRLELDKYAEARLAGLEFRAPAQQPKNFRRRGDMGGG